MYGLGSTESIWTHNKLSEFQTVYYMGGRNYFFDPPQVSIIYQWEVKTNACCDQKETIILILSTFNKTVLFQWWNWAHCTWLFGQQIFEMFSQICRILPRTIPMKNLLISTRCWVIPDWGVWIKLSKFHLWKTKQHSSWLNVKICVTFISSVRFRILSQWSQEFDCLSDQ